MEGISRRATYFLLKFILWLSIALNSNAICVEMFIEILFVHI